MPLPTLVWSKSNFVSSGYAAPTDAQVIQAIHNNVASFQGWREISVDSSTWNYVEIGGPAGGANENMRILISVNPGAGAVLAPDTAASAIWVGIAPDGGTLGTWNSATPYGANRFSKYWTVAPTGAVETFGFIGSDEVFSMIFRDDSLNRNYGFIAGAIVDPGLGSAEANGRVYGMVTSGTSQIAATCNNSTTSWIGHGSGNTNAHMGIFRPNSPTNFDTTTRLNVMDLTTSVSVVYQNGREIAMPYLISTRQNPFYYAGHLRQIYAVGDCQTYRTTTAGFAASGSNSSAADGWMYGTV